MAIFNKFFLNRKQFPYSKQQEQTSERLFSVSTDNVRLVLFRECDFRGRKLLFDSSVVKKVPLDDRNTNEKFVEVSNGFGYMYTKPQADTSQLAEMVFGSVAMSFRGTYFKIHCLNDPQRLMFTQVFPSPRNNRRRTQSNNWSDPRISLSSKSLEHSMKLDDSGASSTNSMSEQLSVYSTVSDTILVCKRQQSTPLDVPYLNTNSPSSNKSLVGDSGCTEPSSSSFSSGPNSIPFWESMVPNTIRLSNVSLSSGSLYKRLLRSTSTSLDQSTSSLTSVSIDECFPKSQHLRSSKLGLAFIVDLPSEQEEYLTMFLMEHIALVESMIWRTRHAVESAYMRPFAFVSLMMDITLSCTKWLVSVLSVPSFLVNNMWRLLSIGCDRNRNSINNFSNSSFYMSLNNSGSDKLWRTTSVSFLDDLKDFQCRSLNSSFNGFSFANADRSARGEFQFFNKFLKSGSNSSAAGLSKSQEELNNSIGRFLKEFCEVVETVDVKDKNFFMSTLLTAVLTHHLGWVATCLPPSSEDYEFQAKFQNPFNSLWSQLSDLYGAVGHPVKMAQTVINGSNNKSSIPKIINSLSYFIRCTDIERKFIQRTNVDEENQIVEDIFKQQRCIPKDYYKKYEDHLKEIMTEEKVVEKQSKLGKTRTVGKNLSNLEDSCEKHECGFGFHFINEQIDPEIKDTFSNDKVIFVLGDNDELVDLKRTDKDEKDKEKESKRRPSYLNLSQPKFECNDCDFAIVNNNDPLQIKPSTSWTSKHFSDALNPEKKLDRAQSEPPEQRTDKPTEVKAKYKYSGVKFNLQQYPQVVTNYMKSKNLEIANLPFGPKYTKLEDLSSGSNTTRNIHFDLCNYENDSDEMEALQTPSNASELEFTSDLCTEIERPQKAKESTHEPIKSSGSFVKKYLPNTVIKECSGGEKKVRRLSKDEGCARMAEDAYRQKLKIINLPMPKSTYIEKSNKSVPYTFTLMRGIVDNYLPGMVLQGLTVPKNEWESLLKNDLSLTSQHSLLDQPVEEAVAIIANTDTWEVQLVSSHTYVIDKGTAGIRVGMSQLVANMLESLLHLWKLNVPPYYCLMYIERKLQELCLRSKALAQFLLSKEFCNMEILTSTLHLEVNDVPLLMAIASTHSPQVTEKYGLSFQ